MLRRTDIADHGAARVDADSEAVNVVGSARGALVARAIEYAERAEATLHDHIRAVENRHHTIAAELVDVAPMPVNDIDLLGQQSADHRKQFSRRGALGKRC